LPDAPSLTNAARQGDRVPRREVSEGSALRAERSGEAEPLWLRKPLRRLGLF